MGGPALRLAGLAVVGAAGCALLYDYGDYQRGSGATGGAGSGGKSTGGAINGGVFGGGGTPAGGTGGDASVVGGSGGLDGASDGTAGASGVGPGGNGGTAGADAGTGGWCSCTPKNGLPRCGSFIDDCQATVGCANCTGPTSCFADHTCQPVIAKSAGCPGTCDSGWSPYFDVPNANECSCGLKQVCATDFDLVAYAGAQLNCGPYYHYAFSVALCDDAGLQYFCARDEVP